MHNESRSISPSFKWEERNYQDMNSTPVIMKSMTLTDSPINRTPVLMPKLIDAQDSDMKFKSPETLKMTGKFLTPSQFFQRSKAHLEEMWSTASQSKNNRQLPFAKYPTRPAYDCSGHFGQETVNKTLFYDQTSFAPSHQNKKEHGQREVAREAHWNLEDAPMNTSQSRNTLERARGSCLQSLIARLPSVNPSISNGSPPHRQISEQKSKELSAIKHMKAICEALSASHDSPDRKGSTPVGFKLQDECYTNSIQTELRRRRRKNNIQLKILKNEYDQAGSAIWTKEKITAVSNKTGLSESQVYKWCWDQKKKNDLKSTNGKKSGFFLNCENSFVKKENQFSEMSVPRFSLDFSEDEEEGDKENQKQKEMAVEKKEGLSLVPGKRESSQCMPRILRRSHLVEERERQERKDHVKKKIDFGDELVLKRVKIGEF